MDAEQTLLAMLLADSRFPAGAHAHSLGLEQAVAAGLRADDVPAFAAARLRLVAEADARVAVAARRGDTPLAELDEEWCARCPSPVLREAARKLGAQLLRSAAAVWDDPRIAVCGQPPVCTALMRSSGRTPVERRNSASSVV